MTFAYDNLGNLTSAADNDSSLAFTYDALSRLTQAQTGATVAQPATSTTYTYDMNGNRLSMTDPQAGVTNYVYDALNRLISLASPQGTSTFAYDALSRRTALSLPNGATATYTYDAASQLLSLVHQLSGSPIASFSYTYDQVGNRTSLTDLDGAHNFVYDTLSRLNQATHPQPANPAETFTYDPVGNRTSSQLATGQIHDAANRLTEDSNFTYTYDANGNLTTKTDKVTGGITAYTYDAEDLLIRVDKPGLVAKYRYDVLSRRIEKVVNGVATRYIYDNEDILLELDGSNQVAARYTHGPGMDEPLINTRGGQSFFYHVDDLGSVWDLTDDVGITVRSLTYDSFGRIVAQTGSVDTPYTYTAREFDPETGLYYYRARYYDPTIGRFLQEDPIGFMGGTNFYAYVRGNPQRFIDPLGLQPIVGIADMIRVRPGSVGFGASALILDRSWNSDNPEVFAYSLLALPQLGGGFSLCRDLRPLPDEDAVAILLTAPDSSCKDFAGERSRTMPAERPTMESPFTLFLGLRWAGVSFPADFSRFCTNFGISIPSLPINVSARLFSQEELVPTPDLGP
ncbi:MAG: RHS repeat domain-containing protein [Anaerolineae bacterium]